MPNHFQDGYKTWIGLANNPVFLFWEKKVKPPMMSGGGPIDEKTMRDLRWRIKSPKALSDFGDLTATGAWREGIYTQMLNLGQRVTVVSVTFPNGAVLSYYGWLEEVDPQEMTEGVQPEVNVKICASMQTEALVEAGFTLA